MILPRNIIRKVSLTIALLLSATLFHIHAATPKVADIKPFKEGFVIAYSDGKLYFTDINGVVMDSIQLKKEVSGIDVREDYVLAVSPDCAVIKAYRNGRISPLCRSQMRNSTDRAVGIACSNERTLILTVGGKILSTVDFDSFAKLDFNSTYGSYYDYTRFCAICASDNFFYIAGTCANGMPAVFTSATGNIWSERTLSYTQGSVTMELEQRPLGLAYDNRMDRFVMACTDGWLFYMPGCSHCNSIERKADHDITRVAFNNGKWLFR